MELDVQGKTIFTYYIDMRKLLIHQNELKQYKSITDIFRKQRA